MSLSSTTILLSSPAVLNVIPSVSERFAILSASPPALPTRVTVRPANAVLSIDVTVLGIVISESDVQPANAFASIDVTYAGIVTVVRLVQPLNVPSPIVG